MSAADELRKLERESHEDDDPSGPWSNFPVNPSEDKVASALLWALPELRAVVEATDGLMEIAEIAMPDSYFESDSRLVAFREALVALEANLSSTQAGTP